jgi:uncharacterized repeat protein (TIGR03803 family)
MLPFRAPALLLATLLVLDAPAVHGAIGIVPIATQNIPSGKTLVVPIVAADPGGPARTYTVTIGAPTTNGVTAATAAGIVATIRTGDPHLSLGVHYYAPSGGGGGSEVAETGTMEFQVLREFSPITAGFIDGLTEGGFYSPNSPKTIGTYVTFTRVAQGFVIQGGDPTGTGDGGPGFTFPSEFNSALIFSASAGQLAMANSNGAEPAESGVTNGSQFFVTLSGDNRQSLDYGYTIFGQLLRGYNTLNGIASTEVGYNSGLNEYSSPTMPVDITSATVLPNNTDAVLFLSATGVCQAQVTVTASSGGVTVTKGFTAHVFSDTINDPPFSTAPVPDITAPNGNVKVTLKGADLQQDLIAYGYQQYSPVDYGEITDGTSPIISVPVTSNTDNLVGAEIDSIAGSHRGFAQVPFHIGAGANPITGSLASIPMGTFAKLNLSSGYQLASFTSGNSQDTAASFTTTVNYGDGTVLSGTQVSIVKNGSSYRLIANHNYANPGEFPVLVTISDPEGAYLNLTGTVNIGASALALSGTDLSSTSGTLTNAVVATGTDNGDVGGAYTAAINWGDGALSAGTVNTVSASQFTLSGSHTYKTPGTYTVSTTATRAGSSAYTASTWVTANISGITAPQVLPPFPQAHLAQIWSPLYTDSNSIITTGSLGGNPVAPIIKGTNGYFYGTTMAGGSNGYGTVYQLSPEEALSTLHTFTDGTDGATPLGSLVQAGTSGNLYGTAEYGGTAGYGTLFQLTTSGSFTTFHNFTDGSDGAYPQAGLVAGTDGNLYGTAVAGGTAGYGTVFEISTSGTGFTVLHTFTSGAGDGEEPYAPMVAGTDGNLYGTTIVGSGTNAGTVYEISETGSFNLLYTFVSGTAGNYPNGANPYGPLVQGTNGDFFGTTSGGGANSEGTLFELTTTGSLTTLHSFSASTDGAGPRDGLTIGSDGNFYGATPTGGGDGYGTVFQLTPAGGFTAIYSFPGGSSGRSPAAGLLTSGEDLIGTAEYGGSNGFGTIFAINSAGTLTTLGSFASADSFQIAIRGAVQIINSGSVTSKPGTFAVYVDSTGTLDGHQTEFTTAGSPAKFSIGALAPGASKILTFYLIGSSTDTRLKLPIGFVPTGQSMIGVVTYSDPVGNFDGSQKIVSPMQF